ncbi:hypothetical protein IAU60_005115 [Kwoniella sp. DSM 27419]
MDPKLKKSLVEGRKSCTLSLRALSSTQNEPIPTPAGLGDAFSGLLVTLRQATTSLGLAFKAPVSVDAAIQQIDKVSDAIGKLISCVLLAQGILAQEWREGIESIGSEMSRHLQTLQEGGDYLPSTGMVWTAIDRLAEGLSKDEMGAVRRRWARDQGVVKDAWDEFKEVLEGAGAADGDDELDDGWDELDLGGEELSEAERKRAEAAKPLLALHQILHATIPRFLDQFSDRYTPLLHLSTAFLDAYDRAVSAMHPEQDEREIDQSLSSLEAISRKLAEMVKDNSTAKWLERLELEKRKWDERRLDLGSLADAI